uniref:Uncharacterized protein n=1 Tax=Cucumis melo TaxID=3656 RepID=A0A9I9E5Y4_CUCME
MDSLQKMDPEDLKDDSSDEDYFRSSAPSNDSSKNEPDIDELKTSTGLRRSHTLSSTSLIEVSTVSGGLMLMDMAGSENIKQAGQIGFEAKKMTVVEELVDHEIDQNDSYLLCDEMLFACCVI